MSRFETEEFCKKSFLKKELSLLIDKCDFDCLFISQKLVFFSLTLLKMLHNVHKKIYIIKKKFIYLVLSVEIYGVVISKLLSS